MHIVMHVQRCWHSQEDRTAVLLDAFNALSLASRAANHTFAKQHLKQDNRLLSYLSEKSIVAVVTIVGVNDVPFCNISSDCL